MKDAERQREEKIKLIKESSEKGKNKTLNVSLTV